MSIPVEKRIDIEKQVVTCIVEQALKKGYIITVFDGEAYPIKKSNDKTAILKELFACDEEMLIIRMPYGDKIGTVTLIYGNDGWDVVNDYSWVERNGRNTQDLMKDLIDEGAVKELTDKLEKEWT